MSHQIVLGSWPLAVADPLPLYSLTSGCSLLFIWFYVCGFCKKPIWDWFKMFSYKEITNSVVYDSTE